MKKTLFLVIFYIISSYSFIYSDCLNLNGTWLECFKSYTISCNNSDFKQGVEAIIESMINSCNVGDFKQSGCSGTAVNKYDPSDTSTFYINGNIATMSETSTEDGFDFDTKITCTMTDENSGTCIEKTKVSGYYSGYYLYCDIKVNMDLNRIIFSKNINNNSNLSENDITAEYISNLSNTYSNQWYLLGTSFGVSDMTIFNKAYSVWSWNNGKWEVYSPVPEIQQLLTKYGLKQLNEIQPKKGFWIYFK